MMDSRKPSRPTSILLYHSLIWLLALAVCFLIEREAQTATGLRVMSIVITAFFIWCYMSWGLVRRVWIDPYSLFLLAVIVFNGGEIILQALGSHPVGLLYRSFAYSAIVDTLRLVLIGIGAVHAGALAAARTRVDQQVDLDQPISPAYSEALRHVGLLLLLVSAVPALLRLYDTVTYSAAHGYAALYAREFATGLDAGPRMLASFIIPASLAIAASSRGRIDRVTIFSAFVVVVYFGGLLISGHRYSAVAPVVAYVWVWHRCVRPIPPSALAAGGVALFALVFPLVRELRSVTGMSRFSPGVWVDTLQGMSNPLVRIINELGSSMFTITHSMALVPATRPFDNGASYLYAVSTIMPNLFWDLHPAKKHGALSDWLIWSVNPATAERGGTIGFSFIAEAYVNFGWVGSAIALALIGYLWARFALWADLSGHPAKIATVASFMSFALLFARAESITIIRPLVWYALVPYAMYLFYTGLPLFRRQTVSPATGLSLRTLVKPERLT